MRRSLARALTGALALVAAAAVAPLGSPRPAPAPTAWSSAAIRSRVADSPWVVALVQP